MSAGSLGRVVDEREGRAWHREAAGDGLGVTSWPARSMPIPRVDGATLKQAIRDHVDPSSTIMTDELHSYRGIGQEFTGGHFTVTHTHHEYVRRVNDGTDFVSTNTAESYSALLKRGHYGIFHQLSKKHLHRYCDEFSFRWNYRKVTDGERMVAAIEGAEGKRLLYG